MLLDMNSTDERNGLVTDFGRDALTLPASEDARRSGEWGAGPETPAVILDWHYARSPFAASMQEARELLGVAAPSEWEEADVSPYSGFLPAQVRRWDASNDNRRLWVVR